MRLPSKTTLLIAPGFFGLIKGGNEHPNEDFTRE